MQDICPRCGIQQPEVLFFCFFCSLDLRDDRGITTTVGASGFDRWIQPRWGSGGGGHIEDTSTPRAPTFLPTLK